MMMIILGSGTVKGIEEMVTEGGDSVKRGESDIVVTELVERDQSLWKEESG